MSLTTYGKRAQSVHLAIESIARGKMLPSRLILWLDDPLLLDNLPIGIRRLQRRGLEVRKCENYGPYKKFYPYLQSLEDFTLPLVTADDDLLYPHHWLKELSEAFRKFPDVVNCHRARVIQFDHDRIAEYESWEPPDSTEPSFRHVATGVAGVIYPVQMQRVLKQAGTAFVQCCPKADDLWLHVQALRAGYKVRQISKKRFRHVYIPDTQNTGLLQQNVGRGENDLQIAATYRASDIDRLRQCEKEY